MEERGAARSVPGGVSSFSSVDDSAIFLTASLRAVLAGTDIAHSPDLTLGVDWWELAWQGPKINKHTNTHIFSFPFLFQDSRHKMSEQLLNSENEP